MEDFERLDNLYATWKTYARRSREIRALLASSPECHDESLALMNEALERSEEKQAKYFTLFVSELTMIDDEEGQQYED